MSAISKPLALVASSQVELLHPVTSVLRSLGLQVETAVDDQRVMSKARELNAPGFILLDAELPGVVSGELLAALDESGIHSLCAIALIAGDGRDEPAREEWIARLREGILDDIVPRGASAAEWSTHLNTMQRGHRLVYELEQLRAATQVDLQLDRLTGVFNRQAMLSILFRETDRVQRLQGTLSLVLLDIDDFSHWNLDLGREACNSLLKQVAERTSRVLRSYDIVGRTGSDEFLIALPGCSTVNAVLTAERLRIEVFAEPFTVKIAISGERQIQLSASYGVALSGGRSPVVVLREAEQAVAQARLRGPDTICCACNRAFSSAPQPALPEIEEEMALR